MTTIGKLNSVAQSFALQYPGVDPQGIYCLFTGKRIGQTELDELSSLVDSLPGDAEDIADDLAMRLFASMRPSMRWNKMRSESLDELRKSVPMETLAYLLNRLFTPLSQSNPLALHHDRIRLFAQLESWGFNESTNTLLYYLIELDAKLGLNTIAPPFSIEMLLSDFESMPILLASFESFYQSCLKKYEKQQADMESSDRWFRTGNTLAKHAHVKMFMEFKPVTESAKQKQAKAEREKFFGDLLFEVLGKPNLSGKKTAPQPTPKRITVPATKMPARFGGIKS